MKKISLLAFLLSFIVIGFTSCSKSSSGPSSTTKTITTQTSTADIAMSVTFTATQKNDGTISKLTYQDGSGSSIQVDNPTMPWSKTVEVPAGSDVSMTAIVTYTNGSVDIAYNGYGTSGGASETISGSASSDGSSSK